MPRMKISIPAWPELEMPILPTCINRWTTDWLILNVSYMTVQYFIGKLTQETFAEYRSSIGHDEPMSEAIQPPT